LKARTKKRNKRQTGLWSRTNKPDDKPEKALLLFFDPKKTSTRKASQRGQRTQTALNKKKIGKKPRKRDPSSWKAPTWFYENIIQAGQGVRPKKVLTPQRKVHLTNI
jgi:hypothetical protein